MDSDNGSSRKSIVETLMGVLYVASFVVFAGLLYFEFLHDISPDEAIDYYRVEHKVAVAENIAFALGGLMAPRQVDDFHGWGIERWNYFRGLSSDEYIEKLDRAVKNPFGNMLEIEKPAGNSNHYCWQPGSRTQDDRCISRKQMESMLQANALVLQRYREALGYRQADFVFGAGLWDGQILQISKQYQIGFWLRRESLSAEDLNDIAEFLHRWSQVVDQGYFNSLGYSIAAINYGYAQDLFHEVAIRYPELLDIYQQNHGEFVVTAIGEELFDRLSVGDFYVIDNEICMSKSFGYANSYCTPNSSSLFYKPGRSLQFMYEHRPLPSKCENPADPRFKWRSSSDPVYQFEALMRPGNYNGRLHANRSFTDLESLCRTLTNHRFRNETFGLYRLHSLFKRQAYTVAQIEAQLATNPETFRIPHSERDYLWDSDSGSLVLEHPDPAAKRKLALPYP